jgi:putative ABC transport system substrate-binding protein
MTVSTPALRSALAAAGDAPVIFTAVGNPRAANFRPATIWQRWLPLLFEPPRPAASGAYAVSNPSELLEAATALVGGPSAIGAVYGPDADALSYRDALAEEASRAGYELRTGLAERPADVAAAASGLCGRGVGAFIALGDRVTNDAFAALVQAAQGCNAPLIGVLREHADAGAVVTLARDVDGAGRTAGTIAARVLQQRQNAATVPVAVIDSTRVIINAAAADRVGVGIPFSLVERADTVIED